MRLLNIDVEDVLLDRWMAWFAPSTQPFLVDPAMTAHLGLSTTNDELPAELRDTYEVYSLPEHLSWAWLDEPAFMQLTRAQRTDLVRFQLEHGRELVPSVRSAPTAAADRARGQADGHRFVWWPSLLEKCAAAVLTAYVAEGLRPSRHAEVERGTWSALSTDLPEARRLAGTFAHMSGPNCFGTVMAAAGVRGADEVWMLREPFEDWLASSTRPGGRDQDPGTVLVWRSSDGLVQHAAVTLGDGWALHKPSQGWMSPTKVLSTDDVKRSSRAPGRRLHRYRLH